MQASTLKHLYLHVPFCKGFCSYCAFYKEPYGAAMVDSWLSSLAREMETIAQTDDLHTIYFGGGTPSVLEPETFTRLFALLQQYFSITPSAEWTIEANPESIHAEKIKAWAAAGVTRVSIGVQSLQDKTLRNMNRLHDAKMVYQAVSTLRNVPQIAVGIDLIAGFPEVEDDDWQQTLQKTLALQPEHISVYECTLHAGTQLQHAINTGRQCELPEYRRDHALKIAAEKITAAGYEHYETSNFCRPGKRCRHNVAVWRGEDYLGLGPSASSRMGYARWTNQSNLDAYIVAAEHGNFPRTIETLSPAQDATERLMFAFRLCDPVKVDSYLPSEATLADGLERHWEKALDALKNQGLVHQLNDRWQTTDKGRRFADHIAEDLLP